jgi:molybdopterin/thiamine biosynthesis adenylyltransferase/rhodanese-related sulfurtransferase
MSRPLPTLSPAELARYSRHLMLDQVGLAGQQRLAAGRVLVIGAGGLGSPAALYLAAGGVGTIGIADFDRVEEHNLQRQLLHDSDAVGQPKVASALRRLRAVNPHVRVVGHEAAVTAENAAELLAAYDVVVDGSDTFATRYLVNDAAVLASKPLVHGSIFRFEGQVAVFDPARGGPCYRCLFPEPPPAGSVPNCGEAGVLGALCGVIGSLQALEAIKLIAGFGEPLIGRLLAYDALNQTFRTLRVNRDPDCPVCGQKPTITHLDATRYADGCQPVAAPAAAVETEPTPVAEFPLEVDVEEAHRLWQSGAAQILDVREPYETSICQIAGSELIPMRQIPQRLADLPRDRHLLVLCHVGSRSWHVSEFLRAQGFTAVSNIAGGISAWTGRIDPTLPRY